jgi:F-type H+-transporting ATPase subunit epsilon
MATMHVELVSVETPIWAGEAKSIYARTTDGEIGVMPGHAPLLAVLEPGWIVRIERDGDTELTVAVHGGFISIRADGVSVMAEMAEEASEIDVARARDDLLKAEADMGPDQAAARDRARARLRAVGEDV